MTSNPMELLAQPFGSFPKLIAAWGEVRGDALALSDGRTTLSWQETASRVERIAARLRAEGLQRGQAVAILGTSSVEYALVYLAAIFAGGWRSEERRLGEGCVSRFRFGGWPD